MKTAKHIALFLLAAALVSCSDDPVEEQPVGDVLCFSASREWPDETTISRSSFQIDFEKGDDIEVFACYSEQANTSFSSPNFMNHQTVSYDGSSWSYSPLKYWPINGNIKFHAWAPTEKNQPSTPYLKATDYDVSSGLPIFTYECLTGLDPFYEANSSVDAVNGTLSGDVAQGNNGGVHLTFHPAPNRYDITATADTILYDVPRNETGDYQVCRFLIVSFKIWGVYKKAEYSMSDDKWCNHEGMYTKEEPLDMTPYLNFVETQEKITGYKCDSIADYVTPRAVIVGESSDTTRTNLFSKPGFFIPADVADIPGNEAGFEIQYVILTNKPKTTEYAETGVITRSGSLKTAFDSRHNGRVHFVTNINLHFTIEELTVTCTIFDYIYKPMF